MLQVISPNLTLYVKILRFSSALIKLGENHSCDSFTGGRQMSVEEIPITRQVTELSLHIVKETAQRIVVFMQVLNEDLPVSDLSELCPLLFHCVYRTAVTMSWMTSQGHGEQCKAGEKICLNFLRRADARWKAAGIYFVFSTLPVRHY